MKNKKSSTVTIIVCGIIVSGILAIIFTSEGTFSPKQELKTVALPLITTTIQTDDNKVHTVKMNLSLGADKKNIEKLEEIDEYSIAVEAIDKLSYEDMRSKNGTEIIKNSVLTAINENFEDGEIDKVYITGIDLGGANIAGMVETKNDVSKKTRSDQLQQWFGN